MFLFTKDRIPLETTGLGVLILLILLFIIFPYKNIQPTAFFNNFGHEALVTICALLILGRGLETTGALQPLAAIMSSFWLERPTLALLATLLVGAICSAFLNNTPIVVMLLPVLVAVCIRAGRPPSKILMPMGLATLIGGMATTIGTSTNLLVVGIAADLGERRFGMFDFTLPVVIAGGAGLLFLWLVAPRLLPVRKAFMVDTSPRLFSAVLYINADGFAPGKMLSEVRAKTEGRMRVDRIQRTETLFVAKLPSVKLQPGDRLYVKDSAERLKEFEQTLGATLFNVSDGEHPVSDDVPLATEGQQLAEVVITRGSALHHRTLNAAQFSNRFGLFPLAIHRARSSQDVSGDLGTIRLRAGDVLLVQGSRESIQTLRENGSMLVLDATTDLPHTKRAPVALGIILGVVAFAAAGILPISVAALCGVSLMLLTGSMQWRDAGDALNIPVIMIIVASLSLGFALMETGGAQFIAEWFVFVTQPLPVPLILSGLILLMTLLTNVVSNNAAAVIGTPVAISIAQQINAPTEPFILAIIFGANMSFATPIGYHTNLLIMSAGNYKFTDFMRIGIPLTLVMWAAFTIILPLLYDL
ncbi:MAG: SLC13 family permease [Gammaproteobacteria bacterium]|nr:SLC13 family permease [Chromatiales bacterium]MDP6673347.1 SLC13 family permease [Gammaproteobacteria bacterium]